MEADARSTGTVVPPTSVSLDKRQRKEDTGRIHTCSLVNYHRAAVAEGRPLQVYLSLFSGSFL